MDIPSKNGLTFQDIAGWIENYNLDTYLGPQNHEKWRFKALEIWDITPKNEGCGFPWYMDCDSLRLYLNSNITLAIHLRLFCSLVFDGKHDSILLREAAPELFENSESPAEDVQFPIAWVCTGVLLEFASRLAIFCCFKSNLLFSNLYSSNVTKFQIENQKAEMCFC